jgi:spore coat protein CotH
VARRWDGGQKLDPTALPARSDADGIFQKTNIWRVDLSFGPKEWEALKPRKFGPMPNFMPPSGLSLTRNPEAPRNGVIGVIGYAFDWTHGDVDLGGVHFGDVAVRKKGNVAALWDKCPFKIDLNKYQKGQKLAGRDEWTFNNLVWDHSRTGEALAYEFFRDCNVPAPRTAYAWLTVSVSNRWDHKPFGLYLMIEPIDDDFAGERFSSKKVPIFKPVTYSLFEYLGEDWSAYAAIYDLKTEATAEQKQRLIDFARLVTLGSDAEFAKQAGAFVGMDQFAQFLAATVLTSSYDGILATGQNFYMYLDPRSNKLGFMPWDLDSAWGNIWIATRDEFEYASIWHPWIGENRLLERLMALEEFRRSYRERLEDFLNRLFAPERLRTKVNELAGVLREPIAAESSFRLAKFEQSVGLKPVERMKGETRYKPRQRAYPFMSFVEARARSVREQLDGKSAGVILKPPGEKF